MDSKDELIEELRGVVTELRAVVGRQAKWILELELAKAKKDSSTYSKPPLSNIVKPLAKKNPRTRRKRKWGGQPGDHRQLRHPTSPDRVNEAFEYEIDDEKVIVRQLTLTDKLHWHHLRSHSSNTSNAHKRELWSDSPAS